MCTSFWKHFLGTTLFLFALFGHSWANLTTNHIDILFDDIILTTNYRYRPMLNQSEPISVYISLVLFSLAGLNEVQQSMSSNVQLTVTWLDETRRWEPQEYGGLTKVHPEPLDIWRPRLFLSNSIADRDMFENDYAPLTIFNTGLTEWLPGGILYTFCPMKMTHFPFDTQTCTLNFTTGEDADKLHLLPGSLNINLNRYDKNGEWLIENTEVRLSAIENKHHVKFILKLNRLSSFTLLNIVIPINIISSLSSLTFIMPMDSGERVSFSITVLLSLTVYTGEISKDLPTNSESLPLLIMYLACLLLHSGFGIVLNLIMLIRYHHTSRKVVQKEDHTLGRSSPVSRKLSDSTLSLDHEPRQEKPSASRENKSSKKNEPCRKTGYDKVKKPRHTRGNKRTRQVNLPKNKRLSSNSTLAEDDKKNNAESGSKLNCLVLAKSNILSYISLIDFVLFVFFFGLWLIITVVFMTLMACGTLC